MERKKAFPLLFMLLNGVCACVNEINNEATRQEQGSISRLKREVTSEATTSTTLEATTSVTLEATISAPFAAASVPASSPETLASITTIPTTRTIKSKSFATVAPAWETRKEKKNERKMTHLIRSILEKQYKQIQEDEVKRMTGVRMEDIEKAALYFAAERQKEEKRKQQLKKGAENYIPVTPFPRRIIAVTTPSPPVELTTTLGYRKQHNIPLEEMQGVLNEEEELQGLQNEEKEPKRRSHRRKQKKRHSKRSKRSITKIQGRKRRYLQDELIKTMREKSSLRKGFSVM